MAFTKILWPIVLYFSCFLLSLQMKRLRTMKYCYRYILIIAAMAFALTVSAQEKTVSVDSVSAQTDSLVSALRSQLQEQQMKNIMMQEQLEKTGEAVRDDSLRLARRKERIDSLRNITPGAPLIIDGDTLLVLYTRRGGILPETRVEDIREKIMEEGKRITLFSDSVYIFDSEFTTDIMIGEDLVMSVTDNDDCGRTRHVRSWQQNIVRLSRRR